MGEKKLLRWKFPSVKHSCSSCSFLDVERFRVGRRGGGWGCYFDKRDVTDGIFFFSLIVASLGILDLETFASGRQVAVRLSAACKRPGFLFSSFQVSLCLLLPKERLINSFCVGLWI